MPRQIRNCTDIIVRYWHKADMHAHLAELSVNPPFVDCLLAMRVDAEVATMQLMTGMNVKWRTAAIVATCYLALSGINLGLASALSARLLDAVDVSIIVTALAAFSFFSGPAGILLALATTPLSWTTFILSFYLGGTLLLAFCLVLSCHRNARVRSVSRIAGISLWFLGGLYSISCVFAYAA